MYKRQVLASSAPWNAAGLDYFAGMGQLNVDDTLPGVLLDVRQRLGQYAHDRRVRRGLSLIHISSACGSCSARNEWLRAVPSLVGVVAD